MKNLNWKKIAYWSLVGVLLVVFVVSTYMVFRNYREAESSATQFEELKELLVSEPAEEAAAEENPLTAAEKYAKVAAKNEDFVGWLSIEGTSVNYPVVQTPKDPEYYLRRGYDKKYSYYGVPFADAACTIPSGDNIVIYGHNMDNGTMFAEVEDYRKKSFGKEHRYIQFDTLEGYGTYEILAVIQTAVGAEDEYKYYTFTDAENEKEFNKFVSDCKKKSLYETGVTAEYGDKLLTLSTCEYSEKNGRIAVIAKKIS